MTRILGLKLNGKNGIPTKHSTSTAITTRQPQNVRFLTIEDVKQVDIQFVTIGAAVRVIPQTIYGSLWLQLHFPDETHHLIPNGDFSLSRSDAAMLAMDAEDAKLTVNYD